MTTPSPSRDRILVWDVPVRVFHWLLVTSFIGAFVTAESERWRLVHVTLGYTVGGLIAFRVLWGLVGTRHARFADFVRGPAAVMRYLGSLLRGRPEHHAGHNPAGALAIVALLGLGLASAATGWTLNEEVGGAAAEKWLEELHEAAANTMLAIVVVHVLAVVASTWLHRENLVRAMVTGRKSGAPAEGIAHAWRALGAAMVVAVAGFWWLQWTTAPAGGVEQAAAHARGAEVEGQPGKRRGGHDDD